MMDIETTIRKINKVLKEYKDHKRTGKIGFVFDIRQGGIGQCSVDETTRLEDRSNG
jgi:hypothetical protein